jgi:hypothetical protein
VRAIERRRHRPVRDAVAVDPVLHGAGCLAVPHRQVKSMRGLTPTAEFGGAQRGLPKRKPQFSAKIVGG